MNAFSIVEALIWAAAAAGFAVLLAILTWFVRSVVRGRGWPT